MEELYVDRYLCPDNQIQKLDTFSFLMGEMSYISPEVVYTMDVYNQFQDIVMNRNPICGMNTGYSHFCL